MNGKPMTSLVFAGLLCLSLSAQNSYANDLIGGWINKTLGQDKTLEEKQREDKQKGAGVGALIGGAIGAHKGDSDRDKLEKGAIGATVGAVIGGAIGGHVAEQRGAYAKEHDEVERAIAATDSKINKIEQEKADIESKISGNYVEISRLTQKTKLVQADINRAKGMLTQIKHDLAANTDLIFDTRTQLKLVQKDIAKIESLIAAHPADTQLVETKQLLAARQSKLTNSLNALNGLTPELLAQRKSLGLIVSG